VLPLHDPRAWRSTDFPSSFKSYCSDVFVVAGTDATSRRVTGLNTGGNWPVEKRGSRLATDHATNSVFDDVGSHLFAMIVASRL